MIHTEEEATGTRIMIGPLSCLMAKEADPSRLAATSPGKLVRQLVASGAHVLKDHPYAEVEVSDGTKPQLGGLCKAVAWHPLLAFWLSLDHHSCILLFMLK